MLELEKNLNKALSSIKNVNNLKELEKLKVKYLGKNGEIKKSMVFLKKCNIEDKPYIGKIINKYKNLILKELNFYKKEIYKKNSKKIKKNVIDITLPGRSISIGNLHPISKTINITKKFFLSLGFNILEGFEIEHYYNNFDALNISKHHPSRLNNDTFWINKKYLLRTQTSCVQIHAMKKYKAPFKIITFGKVYRKDHDKTHSPMFHQIEGLIIDYNINLSKFKNILIEYLNIFFEKKLNFKIRSSYFPFTEPSAEIDIMCKNKKWLEVLGFGRVHPKILNENKINNNIYSGYAFGIGVERLTMLKYNLKDLRVFFENDIRFLKQFR